MEAIRVLHVIDNLSPGGTEKQCLELVRGLSGLGIRIGVFYFRAGPLLGELEPLNVALRTLPCGSFRSGRFPLRLIRMARAIREWAPHIIQTYGFYSTLPGLLAAGIARVPIRIAGRQDLGEHLRPSQRRAQRWVWNLADRIVTNAVALRDQLIAEEGVPSDKVVVIRNGVNLQHWPPPDSAVTDQGNPLVGMVAHFREQKDHFTFLRAAKEILQLMPSVRFCLLGLGPLEPTIRQYAHQLGIADQVGFLGQLEGEALRAAIRQLHVSILTSKDNEGLPNAVLESMAAGLPVVATRVGGTSEVIDEGVTGFLVPPQAPSALAERVICLLKDPVLARTMGERGRQKIEREFTLEQKVRKFQRLYGDLFSVQFPKEVYSCVRRER